MWVPRRGGGKDASAEPAGTGLGSWGLGGFAGLNAGNRDR